MITYLKLAVILFVFGVTLIASSAHADGSGSEAVNANNHNSSNNHHSNNNHSSPKATHGTAVQTNSATAIGAYSSIDRSIEARVNFEERMAERLAEREAEIIVRQAEQAALLATNPDVVLDEEVDEQPSLEDSTSIEQPL